MDKFLEPSIKDIWGSGARAHRNSTTPLAADDIGDCGGGPKGRDDGNPEIERQLRLTSLIYLHHLKETIDRLLGSSQQLSGWIPFDGHSDRIQDAGSHATSRDIQSSMHTQKAHNRRAFK